MKRLAVAVLISLNAAGATAQAPQRVAFVSCPIQRNTPPVPCWLGEMKGQLYYLGSQGDLNADFYPPQFNHRMLVEGKLTSKRACGGVVLEEVKASVLPDIDPACNVSLPAEGYVESDKVRGPGPSGHKGEAPEAPRRPPPQEAFKAPFAARDFTAQFDADTERLWRQAQGAVTQAQRYAAAANAKTVEVTGYRTAIRLSDGKDYVERPGLAQARAEAVAEALRNLGLPAATKLTVAWRDKPAPSAGVGLDVDARKVTITVKP